MSEKIRRLVGFNFSLILAIEIFFFFLRYFQEAWCMALYHDRFKDFRGEVRDILSTPTDVSSPLE